MRRLPGLLLLAGLMLVLPAMGADKKKPDQPDASNDKDIEKLAQLGEVAGKLTNVGSGSVTLQIDYQYLQPNKNYAGANANVLRHQQSMLLQQEQAMRIPNPLARAQRLQQLVVQNERYLVQQGLHNHNALHVVSQKKTYDLELNDSVKVRFSQPPEQFDEKGNIKKYTDKELRELRGSNPNLPGYAGETTSLKNGQVVKVTFGKPKPDPADKEKNKDDEKVVDTKPQVKMILVVAEGNDTSTPAKPKKKDK